MSLKIENRYWIVCDCCKCITIPFDNENGVRKYALRGGWKNLAMYEEGECGFDEDYCQRCYKQWIKGTK